MKVYKKIAIVCLILGVIACIAGVALGAFDEVNLLGVSNYARNISFGKEITINEELNLDRNMDLSLEIKACNGEIVYYDGNTIKLEGNGVLKSSEFVRDRNEIEVTLKGKNTGNFKLYIPRGYSFNEVDLDIDASKVNIENINCMTLDLDSSSSDVVFDKVNCNNGVEIDNNLGNLNYHDLLCGGLEIDNNAGNIVVVLRDKRENYRVNRDGNFSNINIAGDDSYNGYKSLEVETNVGNVNISFKGE